MSERSKTVDQALALLRELSAGGPGSASQLATRLTVNRTSTYRLLTSLEDAGFVRRDADGDWQLGLALLDLAGDVEADVRRVARPVLDDLAHAIGETVVLSVPDGEDVVAVEQSIGERHPVRIDYRAGFRHRQTRAAHGRAYLAFCDTEHVRRTIAAEPEPERAQQLLDETRAAGFASSHDELQLGASGCAVPVWGEGGRVVAALGVVAPVGRLPEPRDLVPILRDGAARITEGLRHRRGLAPAAGDQT